VDVRGRVRLGTVGAAAALPVLVLVVPWAYIALEGMGRLKVKYPVVDG
jgi:hypothetical protein